MQTNKHLRTQTGRSKPKSLVPQQKSAFWRLTESWDFIWCHV